MINIMASVFGWWEIDNAYVAVVVAILFVILGNVYSKVNPWNKIPSSKSQVQNPKFKINPKFQTG